MEALDACSAYCHILTEKRKDKKGSRHGIREVLIFLFWDRDDSVLIEFFVGQDSPLGHAALHLVAPLSTITRLTFLPSLCSRGSLDTTIMLHSSYDMLLAP
ncbi:hypothetical protein F0562_027490 [Nyssa sinensis]|uniref:Uncharacterized protein n=1 Tax=Nyssa sinensis TaxID=561372 RepID=A0A5J5B5P5_9ASTE|nr:hypothetical protein F0562_027490 [Nyssa sinensis]